MEKNQKKQQVFTVLNQYIKDLSFESLNAPYCFADIQNKKPAIQINVQVNVNSISETNFDVVLSFDIESKNDKKNNFSLRNCV